MKVKVSNLYIQNQSIRQDTLRIGRKEKETPSGMGLLRLLLSAKKRKKGNSLHILGLPIMWPTDRKKTWEVVVKVYHLQILICSCHRGGKVSLKLTKAYMLLISASF